MTVVLEGAVKHPKIYAYTTPGEAEKNWQGDRQGKGLIKVGDTGGNVHDRIRSQLSGVKMPEAPDYDLLVSESAVTDDGRIFRDYEVHRELERAGVHRIKNSEWFECTGDEVLAAVTAIREGEEGEPDFRPTLRFKPRREQAAAVKETAAYFRRKASKDRPPHFLWNAKMRFGKNFTAYQLAKEMGWTRILVLTYMPAVEKGWREDLSHENFKGWRFKGKDDPLPDPDDPAPLVWFASFQDVLGTDGNGNPKVKNEDIHMIDWDCLVVDEYHFGAWRDAARNLYLSDRTEPASAGDSSEAKELDTPDLSQEENFSKVLESEYEISVAHYLYLSGTPFRALTEGEFLEDQVFNWTYSDEQRAKAEWDGKPEDNPYASLPIMHLLVYEMPDELRKVAINNQSEFSLTEFFKTKKGENGKPRFVHEQSVQKWLDVLHGQDLKGLWSQVLTKSPPPLPYEDMSLLEALKHTAWYMPTINSCLAMRDLLEAPHNTFFHDYEVIVSAGSKAGSGLKALLPVQEAMRPVPQDKKSITLTVGKLMTGVTVPPWGGIFMLRELNSPESYFQAAFRVQSPWTARYLDSEEGGENFHIFKNSCYVIDFAPNRALSQIVEYGSRLRAEVASERDDEAAVEEFMEFLPVLSFTGYSMQRLSAADIIAYLTSGTSASMLARRWNSAELLALDIESMEKILADEDLIESLKKIETFRDISEDLSALIASNKELKPKKVAKEPLTEEEREKEKKTKERRDDLKKKLQRFLARIPAFMYLTDEREKTIKDIITKVEPELFQQVTELTISDFKKLVDAGVFNDSKMNDAVWKFRDFEEPSLRYGDQGETAETRGGWNLHRDERFARLIEEGILEPDDELVGEGGAMAVVTSDFGIAVSGIRYTTPDEAAIAAGAVDSVDGWAFWGLKKKQETVRNAAKA